MCYQCCVCGRCHWVIGAVCCKSLSFNVSLSLSLSWSVREKLCLKIWKMIYTYNNRMTLINFQFAMVWELYVNRSATDLRWIRIKAGNHCSSAYFICHFQERLIFTLQHKYICYPTKRQTQLYDFGFTWIIWYIPDVYYSRWFTYGIDFNISSSDNYAKHKHIVCSLNFDWDADLFCLSAVECCCCCCCLRVSI